MVQILGLHYAIGKLLILMALLCDVLSRMYYVSFQSLFAVVFNIEQFFGSEKEKKRRLCNFTGVNSNKKCLKTPQAIMSKQSVLFLITYHLLKLLFGNKSRSRNDHPQNVPKSFTQASSHCSTCLKLLAVRMIERFAIFASANWSP